MAYSIELINYYRKVMTKSQFNIYMKFLGEDIVAIGEEDEYEIYTTKPKENKDV